MAELNIHSDGELRSIRRRAAAGARVQQAQFMLAAAGIAAFGIVAVAAAVMSTLF
jgi:uncharacterized protein (DUF1778 family)